MDTDIVIMLCMGSLSIALVLVIVLIFLTLKPFSYEKKAEGPNTCLTIIAKRNIDKVIVKTRMGTDSMTFERKRIRKGQRVDFVFPTPKKPIQLTVEIDAKHQRVFEV